MKNQKGFSLIELLIVVVIIGIIAAIAIPNLLAARRSSNEGSAISSLRTIHGAEMTYQATAGAGQYAGNLSTLRSGNLIDTVLGSAEKSGYRFGGNATAGSATVPAIFFYYADPATHVSFNAVTATGTRYFGIATEGVLYYSGTGGLTVGSLITDGTALNN